MAVTKQKKDKIKSKSKVKPIKNLSEALEKKAWEKVKIKGQVISDDGGDFEGLIGLEVLENYDPIMVGTAKNYANVIPNITSLRPTQPKRTRKQQRMLLKSKKRKTQNEKKTANDEQETKDESSSEDESKSQPKTKKEKLAERTTKKIQKQKEKRQKRRQLKKEKLASGDKNLLLTGAQQQDDSEDEHKAETGHDRFALLRPPPPDNNDEEIEQDEESPELITLGGVGIDDLEGWNGLGVPHCILRALAEIGFKSPTEIQAMSLPAAIMGKKDILGAAETGSGKTLAFGIPILTGILELKAKNSRSGIRKAPKKKGFKPVTQPDVEKNAEEKEDRERTPPAEELTYFPEPHSDDEAVPVNLLDEAEKTRINGPLYAVVLTPTRELAVQVKEHLVAAAKYTGIKVAAIFGGLAVAKQQRLLRQCPEIVVCTPGRFWELYEQEDPHLSKIGDISFLVIDETDRMVEKGHFEELRLLLKVINADEAKQQTRQNFVFSATLTLTHELPEHMQKRNTGKRPKYIKPTAEDKIQSLVAELGISQPKIVDITSNQQTAQTLTECRLICPIDHKDYYLYYFVQRHPGRTIVFCNSIDCVKRLATLFGLLDCNPLPLHANMIQKQRLKNLERFRDSLDGLLIATDVAARGLDIPHVEHVIHYQVPRTSENYVHRSGRTARANRNGITVMFMEPGEVKNYVKLYRTLKRTEDLPLFPVSECYLLAVKERVNLAREVDKQELKLRRNQAEVGWMKKHAEEMEMIIDGYNDSGSDVDEDPFILEKRRDRVHLDNVRTELRSLLSKQIFPRGFSFKYPTSTGQLQMPGISATNSDAARANSAVKVMKDAIEDMKLAKKMRNKKKRQIQAPVS